MRNKIHTCLRLIVKMVCNHPKSIKPLLFTHLCLLKCLSVRNYLQSTVCNAIMVIVKSRKYQGVFKVKSREKTWPVQENWSQQSEIKQVPKGTKQGVWNGKRYLLAWHTRCKCPMETTRNSVKVKLSITVMKFLESLIDFGSPYILSRVRMPFNIRERETSYCWVKSRKYQWGFYVKIR